MRALLLKHGAKKKQKPLSRKVVEGKCLLRRREFLCFHSIRLIDREGENEYEETYSHSIVAGGLLEISYVTRAIPGISLIIRLETCANSS